MQKSPINELGDVFYGLQVQTKIIEDLFNGYDNGLRDLEDFGTRFDSQANLLNTQLKKIKSLVEAIFIKGYDVINQKSVPQDSS
jgi:DNA replication initiation complex subunit (GINS family)